MLFGHIVHIFENNIILYTILGNVLCVFEKGSHKITIPAANYFIMIRNYELLRIDQSWYEMI